MRKDFARIAWDRKSRDEWDVSDEEEIGRWIATLIRTGTSEQIETCAKWLAECAWVVMEREIERYRAERAQMVPVRPVLADQYETAMLDREWERSRGR